MKNDFINATVLQNDHYTVTITVDDTFTVDSTDNPKYDYVYNPANNRRGDSRTFCISVNGKNTCRMALVGDFLSNVTDCAVLENDILTVLQNEHITVINLQNNEVVTCKKLDVFGSNFSIYRIIGGYLIYGEIEILKLDGELNIVWNFSGRDIFVSISGKNAFELMENSIRLYDFEDNFYELDFDGHLISEVLKG